MQAKGVFRFGLTLGIFLLVACGNDSSGPVESKGDSTNSENLSFEQVTEADSVLETFSLDAIYDELLARSTYKSLEDSFKKVNTADTLRPILRNQELARFSNKELYDAYTNQLDEIKVIYGEDNRMDLLYSLVDGELIDSTPVDIKSAAKSVVAIVPRSHLIQNADGSFQLLSKGKYRTHYQLCDDEKFADQDVVAECTGFAMAGKLVATAGHCINKTNFRNYLLVFDLNNYVYSKMGNRIPADLVYEISDVVVSKSGVADFCALRVNKEIPQHRIARINTTNIIDETASYYVIGFPCGIPMKLVNHSSIVKNDHASFFVINSDTYGGNSGSPVFNSKTNLIEGILVRGNTDFVIPYSTNCRKSVVCYNRSCRGEDVTRIRHLVRYINP